MRDFRLTQRCPLNRRLIYSMSTKFLRGFKPNPAWTYLTSMQSLRFIAYNHTLFRKKTALLYKKLPARWIGRERRLLWPPCSPDLTQLDFFMWGFVKSTVDQSEVTGLDYPKTHIAAADMLPRTWQKLEYGEDIVPDANGANTAVYWGKSKPFENLTISHSKVQVSTLTC